MKKVFAVIGATLAGIYIINPTAGFFELIPDNLPVVGNIDEAGATALLLYCLKIMGIDPFKLFGSKGKKSDDDVIDVE